MLDPISNAKCRFSDTRSICFRRLLKNLTRASHPDRSGEERVAKSKGSRSQRLRFEFEPRPKISENRGRERRWLLNGIVAQDSSRGPSGDLRSAFTIRSNQLRFFAPSLRS